MTIRLSTLLLVLSLAGGCALYQPENRVLMNALDKSIAPKSPTTRAALLPLTLPASLLCLSVDGLIVQNAIAMGYAGRDTGEYIWPHLSDRYLDRMAMAPLQAIATPIFFAGDWLWRWMLPFTKNIDTPEESDESDQNTTPSSETVPATPAP